MTTPQPLVLSGDYALLSLPSAASYKGYFAWVNDQPVNPKMYWSNGVSWAPVMRRSERYSGVSDVSGNWTVVYPSPFIATPDAQPVLLNPTVDMNFRLTAQSATGFTVNVFQRSSLTVLGLNLLSFATVPVVGQSVFANVFEA